jgi:small GTP-binding protein
MSTIQEQIEAIEKEIRETPYDKSTERHHGMLRARMARLKEKQTEAATKGSGGGVGYAVKKQGDATIVLVGRPSVGKSTLINNLTNAHSKVAPYAFTTLTVIPGMMHYQNANIQILDVPGIIKGAEEGKGRGREVLSVIRGCDLIVIITDPKNIDAFETIPSSLERNGIRINQKPADITIDKKPHGGISIQSNIRQDITDDAIKEMAHEFGVRNADITIREKVTYDQLIDAFSTNRVYVRAINVLNKVDEISVDAIPSKAGSYTDKSIGDSIIKISAEKGIGIDDLKKEIWKSLGFVQVYLVRPFQEPTFDEPFIALKGQRLSDIASEIGSEFAESKTKAKIWGTGAKFPGQDVSLSTEVKDGMQVRFL